MTTNRNILERIYKDKYSWCRFYKWCKQEGLYRGKQPCHKTKTKHCKIYDGLEDSIRMKAKTKKF